MRRLIAVYIDRILVQVFLDFYIAVLDLLTVPIVESVSIIGLFVLYNYIVDVKFNGVSIGKKIVGVRSVVPENKRSIYNKVHGILRYFFFAVGPITLIYYLITKRVPYDRWFDIKIQKRKIEYDI